MKAAPVPPDGKQRLRLLRHLEVMDTDPDEIFDALLRALMLVCNVRQARVCLTAEARQWYPPGSGRTTTERAEENIFCMHTLEQDGVTIIPDTANDPRFINLSESGTKPQIRFYAGAPLKLPPGYRFGSVYVTDQQPRKLDATQTALLELIARHIITLIKLRMDRVEASREFSSLVMVKQKLQFQKDLVEAILDNEPEGVLILSTDGRLEQVNRAGLDMLEVNSMSEARQKKLIEYVHPDHQGRLDELQKQVFDGKHAIAEYKIRGNRGGERWLETHAAPLRNLEGTISELIAVTRDVSEVKQSQQRLVLAARVFREAQEGIIITDASTTIVDVNPTFCHITGYTREEVIGKTPRILRSGLQGPEFYESLWKTLSATGHWKGEIWSRKKNGELYAELISINALRDQSGNAINYVALFLDITDIKKQQGDMPTLPGS